MNSAINELVRSIVKKNSLAECSVSELQRLTTQYPYFGPVQFLLARKLKEDNSPLYGKQTQKAILYFQDDLWFEYVTNGKNNAIFTTAPAQEIVTTTHTEIVEEEVEEPPPPPPPPPPVEIPVVNEEVKVETEEIKEIFEEKTIDPIIASVPEAETFYEETEVEPISGTEITPVEEPEVVHEEKEKAPVEYDDAIPMPALKIEPFNPDAKFTFEPYHTVDYFASQGIRFKDEEKPKDQFGKQLKSFTEWLKTLKKVPETGQPPAKEDKNVTHMADQSLTDREVVTEAMADVWEKQGNHEKAINTYHKLSLLNPSKSAYFAAKIEQLKRQ